MELSLGRIVELCFLRIEQSSSWLLMEQMGHSRAKAGIFQQDLNYSVYTQRAGEQLHGECAYTTLCVCYCAPVARLPKPDF